MQDSRPSYSDLLQRPNSNLEAGSAQMAPDSPNLSVASDSVLQATHPHHPHFPSIAPSQPAHSISVESLFRNLPAPSQQSQSNQPQPQPQSQSQPSSQLGFSPVDHDAALLPDLAPAPPPSERQNALLSLLGGTMAPSAQPQSLSGYHSPPVQRYPGDAQGKQLLDQLIPPPNDPLATMNDILASLPPSQTPPAVAPQSPPNQSGYPQRYSPTPPPPFDPQQHGKSSLFDFVSPFDVLAPGPNPAKKKPIPSGGQMSPRRSPHPDSNTVQQQQQQQLIQILADGQRSRPLTPQYHPSQPHTPDLMNQQQQQQRQMPSPPRGHTVSPPQQSGSPLGPRGDRDGSPQPTGSGYQKPKREDSLRIKAGQVHKRVPVPQVTSSPTYVLDMLAPLQSTQASPGLTVVTPIALLKLDPLYLQGTTIGVSGFIAYAMTKGRVRLIARSNGARSLLRLPPAFPPSTSVQDMVVSGNRLACVTSDGGLVVWEVPQVFDDDTQSRTLLHVLPTSGPNALKVVKWHPKQPTTLAVASEREIHLLNVAEAADIFHGEPIRQDDLASISKVFSIPSPLISFTFDVPQIALASISIDSTITLWSIKDKLPFWSGRIAGEGQPSSIDFLEGGIIVGRKQGTVLQLLPVMSTVVSSTVKFVLGTNGNNNNGGNNNNNNSGGNGGEENGNMFGHVSYDPKIRTLWVANSARGSLFALRVSYESFPSPSPSHQSQQPQPSQVEPIPPPLRPIFEQIVEFPTTMQCINMTLLADGGDPANADPGLAVALFAVHMAGVDQVNISREAFEGALGSTAAKMPVPVGGGGNGIGGPSGGQQGGNGGGRERERDVSGGENSSAGAGVGAGAVRRALPVQPLQIQPPPAGPLPPPIQSQDRGQDRGQQGQGQSQGALRLGGIVLPPPGTRTPPSEPEPAHAHAHGLGAHGNIGAGLGIGPGPGGMGGPGGGTGSGQERGGNEGGGRQPMSKSARQRERQNAKQAEGREGREGKGQGGGGGGMGVGVGASAGIPGPVGMSAGGAGPSGMEGRDRDRENDPAAIAKEIKKIEDNLHTRIGRLISRELDKQHQRLEELRVADQAADFSRQETILKLISHELTKNTTRVVELAVKSEVQNSVLPALEAITKGEIRAALNAQIVKGLSDSMKQTLPNEIERLLLRPDVSNHIARTLSSAVTPQVERHVKDAINKNLIPAYTQATTAMHQELSREIHAEILNLRKEVVTWQADAVKNTEAMVFNMEQTIRTLNEQVKTLSMQLAAPQPVVSRRVSPPPQNTLQHSQSQPSHLRQTSLAHSQSNQSLGPQPSYGPPQNQPSWMQNHPSLPPAPQHALPPPPPQQHSLPPPPQQQQQQQQQPQQQQQQQPRVDDWDGTFLMTLSSEDPKQLRDLLSHCNPEVVMPTNGRSPLSQAVILTIIHRLSSSIAELSPVDESFKSGLWWLQRAAYTLVPDDPVITPYVKRVLQTAQSILGTTASRLSLLPGGQSLIETNNMISQIQQTLATKN
ncbi:hypothetical protein BOTBODRAFT_175764 [Botryobasidium botryosum FD-172 SS1]|uniref:Enhancer of mRNA-decapping protein 4 WD40 repeat region domain-containing protein n=1 Tax=Botryobasidium botryosum (strain FD-172 SS1) TaxID=930990 RepID=A0A067MC59_BOTB1|nr:hypothetical protein BOTBODRAFT_175764 [Botryobasidium botryosum FD-172 SS1]